jgi:hypothetical protein
MAGDDARVGHVLTRREVLGLVGTPAVLMLAGWSAPPATPGGGPGCVVRPQQTEGAFRGVSHDFMVRRSNWRGAVDERATQERR